LPQAPAWGAGAGRWGRLVAKRLLLPPGGLLLAASAGAFLTWAEQPAGLFLLPASLAALWLLATPAVARRLLATLDRFPPVATDEPRRRPPAAIVVLDGGRRPDAREVGGDWVNAATLERLAHGAWLHRRLGLPLLVSGDGAGELMARALGRSFGVAVRWLETRSRTTQESAVACARRLRASGIDHAYLVSHFWHLPRAAAAFRRAGLELTPAPVGLAGVERGAGGVLALLPSARAVEDSYLALHEHLGRLWYRLRYGAVAGTGGGRAARPCG